MRRSLLWMCAVLAIATWGCKQVNDQYTKVKGKIAEKIAAVRHRPPPGQPAPGAATTPPSTPPTLPATPAQPTAPATPGPRALREPVLQAPPGARLTADVAYDSPDTGTIAPGMGEKDVYSLWGAPVAVRRQGDMTFLYFRNGCEYTCGTEDVVFLQNGQVVDAIVRWPGHGYSGQSSSPAATQPHARRGGDTLTVKRAPTP